MRNPALPSRSRFVRKSLIVIVAMI
jgi:hypothetical protein